jgi:hypothetical protein
VDRYFLTNHEYHAFYNEDKKFRHRTERWARESLFKAEWLEIRENEDQLNDEMEHDHDFMPDVECEWPKLMHDDQSFEVFMPFKKKKKITIEPQLPIVSNYSQQQENTGTIAFESFLTNFDPSVFGISEKELNQNESLDLGDLIGEYENTQTIIENRIFLKDYLHEMGLNIDPHIYQEHANNNGFYFSLDQPEDFNELEDFTKQFGQVLVAMTREEFLKMKEQQMTQTSGSLNLDELI